MKFVLNVQKGSTINHPAVGALEGGIARQVSEDVANQLKHVMNVIVFDSCVDEKGVEL